MKRNHKAVPIITAIFTLAVFSTGFTSSTSVTITDETHEALTDQVWAVKVVAEPGETGSLSQEFEAAYGAYDAEVKDGSTAEVQKDSFGFDYDDDGEFEVIKGEDYVGNYFHIDQEAGTTGGTTKRYIDISSPWSGAYVHEDMKVVGEAEVEDTFRMDNLEPGEEAVPEWHDLF